MTKLLEIAGKTIDEAIETACREFAVPREKLNIEILTEGSSGLFGLGAKKAKIKASLLTLDVDLGVSFEESGPKPERKTERKPDRRPEIPVQERAERKPDRRPEAPVQQRAAARAESKPAPAAAKDKYDDTAPKAAKLLEEILQRMKVNASVSVDENPETIVLKIEGNDNGLLIGKRGQTLDALQYVVNKAVNRQERDRRQIVIDTEEYRKKREEALIALAEKLAQKVKKTRKSITVNNMNARERRIIHMALQGDESLTTKSRGEGSHRKIIIQPSKKK